MHYIYGNIIFHFIYDIFDEEFFSKYINSCVKEHQLYNKLLDKISLEIELLVLGPSNKDKPTLVPILLISIPPIQNNSPPQSPSPSLSYGSLFLLPSLVPK